MATPTLTTQNGIFGVQSGNQFTNASYASPALLQQAGATQDQLKSIPKQGSSPQIAQPANSIKVSTPVISGKAAQDDYNKKFAEFQKLQADIQNQSNSIAKQQAQLKAEQAQKQLQESQIGLQQQGIDLKKAEVEAKNYALGLANQAKGTELPAPNAGTAVSAPQTPAVSSGLGLTSKAPTSPRNGIPSPYTGEVSPATQSINTIDKGLQSADSQYLQGKQQINNQQDVLTTQINQSLDALKTGTIPLSAPQQSLVNSLQTQLQQNIQSQQLANQSFTNSVKQAGFRAGGEYTPELYAGQIAQSISYGVSKVQELDNQAASTMAQLESSFQSQNFNVINQQYSLLTDQLDRKANAITDTYNEVTKQLQAQKEYYQKQQEQEIQSSRDDAVGGLIQQGVTDPSKILDYLNYDDAGNKIGDFTAKEVKETMESLLPKDNGVQDLVKSLSENKTLTAAQKKEAIQKVVENKGDINAAYLAASPYFTELGIGGHELLTISEAKDLGLPYGTTRDEAIKANRVPGAVSLNTDPVTGQPINPEVVKGNAADYQTINSATVRINGILSQLGEGKNLDNITKEDVDSLSTADIEALAKQAARIQNPDIARAGGNPQASLAQTSKIAWTTRFLLSQIGLMKKYDPDQVIDLLKDVNAIQKESAKNLMPGTQGAENMTIAPDGEHIEIID